MSTTGCPSCGREAGFHRPDCTASKGPRLFSRLIGKGRVHLGDGMQTYCGKPIETALPLTQPRAVLLSTGTPLPVDCEECVRIHPTRVQTRDGLQAAVLRWVTDTFGASTINPRERVLRVLEEAIELAQAEGVPAELARGVLEHVYKKPPGDPAQEIGGVGVTLLGYCAVKGISADAAERAEAERVFAVDPTYFRERHNAKAAAGIATWTDARVEAHKPE